MFMVNQTKEGSGFWASNKSFVDGLFKAGAIIFGLKLLKVVVDKFDQWLFMHMIPIIHPIILYTIISNIDQKLVLL